MSDLLLIPIGYPGESDIARASQQKATVLLIALLILLTDIGSESGNDTYEFFLQLFSLLSVSIFCSANR